MRKALVFAAGLGTRLRPLTHSMPKALVPVGGKPLLGHVIEKLVAGGYDSITVNVHHFPDMIIDYLQSRNWGAEILVSDERDALLETGGGVMHAREMLQGGGSFLVHNVDILSNLDLEWFRSQHRPGAMASLLVSERETQRYLLFDSDMRLCGWTNIATGEVRSPFGNIDPSKYRHLAFSGIHIMSDSIFTAMEGMPERFPIMDFYLEKCAAQPIFGVEAPNLKLVDVGKLQTLSQAEVFLDSFQV